MSAEGRAALWALTAVVGTLLLGLGIVELLHAVSYSPMPPSGEVALNASLALADLGVGADKRLLVLNLSAIGGVGGVDDDDKREGTLHVWRHGLEEEVFPMAVEYKGGGADRDKKAFAIELRDATGDDVNERLFDQQEKVSDYVLRPGFFEPTLVRDALAPRLAGLEYSVTLVEVVVAGEPALAGDGRGGLAYEGACAAAAAAAAARSHALCASRRPLPDAPPRRQAPRQ